MNLNYEDLICGDPIPIPEVGHIRSPHLYELMPSRGIGFWTYNLYLNLLSWDKEDLINFARSSMGKKYSVFSRANGLNAFDIVTLVDMPRQMMIEAMSFFMLEDLVWCDDKRYFSVRDKETQEEIGKISRENFDEVRDMMLQMNYVSSRHVNKAPHFSNEKARALWENAQKHLREAAKNPSSDKRMNLGNIISKLSCVGVGYTLLNIYDLTVFQLYDQFFQYGYLRAMGISDMAYSNHGGKNFDIQAWLKPITNFKKEKQQ